MEMRLSSIVQFFSDIQNLPAAAISPTQYSSPVRAINVKSFLDAVSKRIEEAESRQRQIEKKEATGFNIFDLIEPDENKLSDILAGLLDPKGKHGQGDQFLRLLLEQLNIDSPHLLTKSATVLREAPTHQIRKYRRRMDILVRMENGVLLAIENKVDSLEQPEQVQDYLKHLQCCAVNEKLIYLTPDGRPPQSLKPTIINRHAKNGKLYCWSYQRELRLWLEVCRENCNAARIRDFLTDFIVYIETNLNRQTETSLLGIS